MLVDGQECGPRVNPRARVVIFDTIAHQRKRGMRVSAKNTLAAPGTRVVNGPSGDLVRQAQPAGIRAIQKTRKALGVRVQFLNSIEQLLANAADKKIFADEPVKLVAMHREMALAFVLPHVALIDWNADEMRHQVREAVVMIAFHPDHRDVTLGVGELADVSEELPVVAGQAAEVEVGKNIAQQHQAAIAVRLQNVERILSPAHFGPKMDVRQNQCVVRCADHALDMRHFLRRYGE